MLFLVINKSQILIILKKLRYNASKFHVQYQDYVEMYVMRENSTDDFSVMNKYSRASFHITSFI